VDKTGAARPELCGERHDVIKHIFDKAIIIKKSIIHLRNH
jgi:hypothetical protein